MMPLILNSQRACTPERVVLRPPFSGEGLPGGDMGFGVAVGIAVFFAAGAVGVGKHAEPSPSACRVAMRIGVQAPPPVIVSPFA